MTDRCLECDHRCGRALRSGSPAWRALSPDGEFNSNLPRRSMKARQVEAIVNLSSNPCIIAGDQLLLQQVLVNLVINAMDAMAETPPARRRITISIDVRAADVEVSCAILERVCRCRSRARCSRHLSRRKRTALGSASRSHGRSSTRMAAPSSPATIPKGARHLP